METVSGFIDLHKPAGISSAAAVSKVRRLAGVPCGHMGTLDPMASGVLPVAVGNASRLFPYLLGKEKVYRAVFRFGAETDTLDAEGKLLREGLSVPSEEQIRAALPRLTGEIDQLPPAFSAKSVGGVRAYKLARAGKEVALQPKRVSIRALTLLGRVSPDSFAFSVTCGGGTYIRSLARDIAALCGTAALMTSLVRERSGPFTLEDSVAPDALTPDNWRSFLRPPEEAFEMEEVCFAGEEAWRLRNGQRLPSALAEGEYKLRLDGGFYGIARAEAGALRAKVKLV